MNLLPEIAIYKSSRPEAFLEKGVLKICNKFTGEHLCRSAISCNFWAAASVSASCHFLIAMSEFLSCMQDNALL